MQDFVHQPWCIWILKLRSPQVAFVGTSRPPEARMKLGSQGEVMHPQSHCVQLALMFSELRGGGGKKGQKIGAKNIRMGFGGPLCYGYNEQPPK